MADGRIRIIGLASRRGGCGGNVTLCGGSIGGCDRLRGFSYMVCIWVTDCSYRKRLIIRLGQRGVDRRRLKDGRQTRHVRRFLSTAAAGSPATMRLEKGKAPLCRQKANRIRASGHLAAVSLSLASRQVLREQRQADGFRWEEQKR